jgi:hypothetical protein
MKVKGEKVKLLVIGNGKITQKKAIKLKDNVLISEDGKGYLRRPGLKNPFELFLLARLEPKKGEQTDLNDIYQAYYDFCQEYGFNMLPSDKFVKALSAFVEIQHVQDDEGAKLVAKDVVLVNREIHIEEDSVDLYYFEKGEHLVNIHFIKKCAVLKKNAASPCLRASRYLPALYKNVVYGAELCIHAQLAEGVYKPAADEPV